MSALIDIFDHSITTKGMYADVVIRKSMNVKTKSCDCDDCLEGKECPCDKKAMSWLNTGSGGALVGATYKPKIGDEVSVVDSKGNIWIEKGIVTYTSKNRTEVIGDEKTSGVYPNKYLKQLGKDLSHKHQYSSTQFDLAQAGYNRTQGSPIPALQAIQDQISDDDLAEDGKESNFHITVKYGLHGNDANEVREVIKQWMKLRQEQPGGLSCTATLGEVSLFPAGDSTTQRGGDQYDVVKVEVTSPDLEELNQFISDNLEHTDTHPIYQPHVTLAYVRPGMGKKYAGLHLNDHYVILHKLVFSDRDGEKTTIDFWDMDNIEPQSILPNLSAKMLGVKDATDMPKQNLRGKPCGVGQTKERDGCIPNAGNEQAQQPVTQQQIQPPAQTKPISGSGVSAHPENGKLQFDPNKVKEQSKPSEEQVLSGGKQSTNKWKPAKAKFNERGSRINQKAWDEIMPEGITKESCALLTGVSPDNETANVVVNVDFDKGKPFAIINLMDKANGIQTKRVIAEKGIVTNEMIAIDKDKQGQGQGTEFFARQVDVLSKAGMKKIQCEAYKDRDNNGYYTWPRLGYDASIDAIESESVQNKVRAKFPEAKTIQDLYKTKEGREWWKANGDTVKMEFDLSEGSKSRQILSAYQEEKRKQKATKPEQAKSEPPKTEQEIQTKADEIINKPSFLRRMANLPKAAVAKTVNFARNLYDKAEAKYGSRWAKAIVGTAIITMPTPFTLASVGAMTGLAHLWTKYVSKTQKALAKALESLDMDKVRELAEEFIRELYSGLEITEGKDLSVAYKSSGDCSCDDCLEGKECPCEAKGKDLSIAYKSNVEGQPCTPGHTAERDHCIPESGETASRASAPSRTSTYTPEQIQQFRSQIPASKIDQFDEVIAAHEAEQVKKKPEKIHPRIKELIKQSNEIEITDDMVSAPPMKEEDYDEIERVMTEREKDTLEDKIRSRVLEDISQNMDVDVNRNEISDSEYDQHKIYQHAQELLDTYKRNMSLSPDLHAEITEVLGGWYENENGGGEYGVREIKDILMGYDHSLPPKLLDDWKKYQREVVNVTNTAVDRATEKAIEEAEENALSDYDDTEIRRELLREFYRVRSNNVHDLRFKKIVTPDVWGKNDEGDLSYNFKTSSDNGYEITVYKKNIGIIGQAHTLQFADASGSYDVTGAGNAVEVFSKVTAAVVSLMNGYEIPILTYTAAEQSRQKLYDRLTKTVLNAMPDYDGILVPSDPKRYIVAKRDVMDKLKAKFMLPEKSFDPEKPYEEITPEIEDEWFTEEGWEEDVIPGGLADDVPTSKFDPKLLNEGIKVEMEHTSDPDIAREIAKDHLMEDPQYYRKLRKVEGKDLSVAYKAAGDMEGKPCTTGHTEYRDHCIPADGEHGGKQEHKPSVNVGDKVTWNFNGKRTTGWTVHKVMDNGYVVIKKGTTEKVAKKESLELKNKKETAPKRQSQSTTNIPKLSDDPTENLISPDDVFIDERKFFGHGQEDMPVGVQRAKKELERGIGERIEVKEINIRDLIPTQDYTGVDKVKKIAKEFDPKKAMVQVIKKNGKLYIYDGHHTAAAALLAGKKTIKAELINEDVDPIEKAKQDWKRNGVKSQAFKNWFGDWENDPDNASKVVDDDGTPKENYEVKKVFHGTTSDFEEFDLSKVGSHGSVVGNGFYFAENEEVAKTFSQGSSKGRVISAYLNIRVPFDFDSDLTKANVRTLIRSSEQIAKTFKLSKFDDRSASQIVSDIANELNHLHDYDANPSKHDAWIALSHMIGERKYINDVLKAAGWDGIVHTSRDFGGTPRKREHTNAPNYGKCWVAFNPTQIKSTDNQGTFDPNNPHIGKDLSTAQNMRGKPCTPGHTTYRDGCISDDGQQAPQQRSSNVPIHTAKITGTMSAMIDKAKLSPKHKEQYKAAVSEVIARMPIKAAKRIQENVKKIRFYESARDLTAQLKAERPEMEKVLPPGKGIPGYYSGKDQGLNLDGAQGDQWTTAGLYAHEISHAIDGPDQTWSKTQEWEEAWKSELGNAVLSKYASSKPVEGWAEFGRAIYAGHVDLAELESKFPKCAAVWKGAELWPS